MSTRASLTDLATLKQHGYTVSQWNPTARPGSAASGWQLLDPEGANLMIGERYGCIAPTQWEAVAEGLSRIAQDERCERAQGADFFRITLSSEQLGRIERALDTLNPDGDQAEAEIASARSAIRDGAEPVR